MNISEYAVFLTLSERKMPLYLPTIGRAKYQTLVHRPLGIEDGQFLYSLRGKGIAFVNGQTYEMKEGTLFYLPPNTAQEYHCDGDVWETIYITFGGSGLAGIWDVEPFVRNNAYDFEFEKWYDILYKYKNTPNCEKEISVSLYAMLLDFKDKLENTTDIAKKKIHILTGAMHEMAEKKNVALEDIARRSGVSEAHFCRIFKEYTGYRPFEYMNMLKIQKAKELLKNTDMSVCEISKKVGYESHSYFSMLFKRYMGITPSEYRK
ncbi:MAG: AraC family transcriptional regulator [Clostridia bacterium]|nr:AraC family transcriptional regulator [Clostridia bacterium]